MASWFLDIAGIIDLGLIQGLVFAGLAFSVVLSLISLDFPDLSIGGTFPLGAAVAAVWLQNEMPLLFIFPITMLAGAMGGLLTGIMHVRFGMSKLLSGICTATIFYTINIWIMGNRPNLPVIDQPTYLTWFETIDTGIKQSYYPSTGIYFHTATIVGCFLVIIVLKIGLDYLLASEFGVVLRGVGQNEEAARYYRRNPATYKVVGLGLANASAALAGCLAAQYQGFSDVHMGTEALVLALIAVILGQELFARLGYGLTSTSAWTRSALLGVIVYQIILAAVLRIGVPPTSLRMIAGIALVAVVALRQRRKDVTFSW